MVSAASAQAPSASASPYPYSHFITGIKFHFNTVRSAAKGSDIWPVTWAANNGLYTAWGDGKGFSGTEKVSWGIARLQGKPGHWHGKDVYYGPPGSHKGKISGLLAIGNILYAWENMQNRKFPYCTIALIKSTDRGRSWSKTPVSFKRGRFKPVSFLHYDRGYQGAKDAYVYVAGFKTGDETHSIYLMRVPENRLEHPEDYASFSGMGSDDAPLWSNDTSRMRPVFQGVDNKDDIPFPVIAYNKGLASYILTDCHGPAGNLGIFEASAPWGPWRTVYYGNHWGGLTQGAYLGFEFPNKWVQDHGRRLQMVFSVYDSNKPDWNDACNIMTVTLTTAGGRTGLSKNQ